VNLKSFFEMPNAYLAFEWQFTHCIHMLKEKLFGASEISTRNVVIGIVLVANTLIWYSYAFNFLNAMINEVSLPYAETLIMWSLNFIGGAISAIIGTLVIKKTRWFTFISIWMSLGIVSSLIPVVSSGGATLLILSLLFGISFGLGLPASLKFCTQVTKTEMRGRFSGIILLFNGLGLILVLAIESINIIPPYLILAFLRAGGLLVFLLLWPPEKLEPQAKTTSYVSILKNRQFIFYFIPWIIFSLVSYLSLPILFSAFEKAEATIRTLSIIESVLTSCFAVVSGFLADYFGRKRVVIAGFILFGLGYAILGINAKELSSWYFYTVVDGIAWGIFYTIFVLTLWGDLSNQIDSDKYYALGGLPFFLASFVRFILASFIADNVPYYAIFSFAALFLFLAVLPLMYAPETLPEKTMKDRDLKSYTEKALKQAQKDADKSKKKDSAKAEEEKETEETPQDEEARKLAEKYY
jgi:hypothetical protein